MKWLTKQEMYEDFPLYLRKPDYDNIWKYKNNLPKLLNISFSLTKVRQNGLPESDYNLSLEDFDSALCNLFDNDLEGIIFLIETYDGERNYWYYISSEANILEKGEKIKNKFPNNRIKIELNHDVDWGFINSYPFDIY